MAKKKPAHIEFYSARFNLKNPPEQRAVEIIQANEAQGMSFKQLAVTAILLQAGVDLREYIASMPQSQGVTRDDLERLLQDTLAVQLEHYTDELLRQLRKRGNVSTRDTDDYEDAEVSDVARNFAKGYLQRKRQGDDE